MSDKLIEEIARIIDQKIRLEGDLHGPVIEGQWECAEELAALLSPARDEALEEAAQRADSWTKPDVVKLAAGEMTAQELRTAIAVAKGIAAAIRARKSAPAPQTSA